MSGRAIPPASLQRSVSDLAIVAGEGLLPQLVARACVARGMRPLVVWLSEKPSPSFEGCTVVRPPSFWAALRLAKTRGIARVVMAGGYRRSTGKQEGRRAARHRLLAFVTERLIARHRDARALRRLAWLLRCCGIRVLAPQHFCPALCPDRRGKLGKLAPSRAACKDIAYGRLVLDRIASLDMGQGVVVAQGLVLALETLEGTDALLESVRRLKKQRSIQGGVLVKLPKTGQRRDLDLPAIGVRTLTHAARAGLHGVAFEAQGALLLPPDETIRQADRLNLFLYSVAP